MKKYCIDGENSDGRCSTGIDCIVFNDNRCCIDCDKNSNCKEVCASMKEMYASQLNEPSQITWETELAKVNQLSQTQESLNDQLQKLWVIANRFGLYDAADYIKR